MTRAGVGLPPVQSPQYSGRSVWIVGTRWSSNGDKRRGRSSCIGTDTRFRSSTRLSTAWGTPAWPTSPRSHQRTSGPSATTSSPAIPTATERLGDARRRDAGRSWSHALRPGSVKTLVRPAGDASSARVAGKEVRPCGPDVGWGGAERPLRLVDRQAIARSMLDSPRATDSPAGPSLADSTRAKAAATTSGRHACRGAALLRVSSLAHPPAARTNVAEPPCRSRRGGR